MTQKEQQFVKTVWEFYERHGRHSLPWRSTKNPYKILVSELMLQQTQVDRVIPKYVNFMKRFPTARKLAAAPLGEVLEYWQGLGYNRRAKFLWLAAKEIETTYNNRFPKSEKELLQLPGIGPYTASAILTFAYNQPVTLIETNVRTVYIHHFFKSQNKVSDTELLPLITRTTSAERSAEWYAAVMDYGTYLKKEFGNNISQSAQYKKQSTFKGSDREVRGAIIKLLLNQNHTDTALKKELPFSSEKIKTQLIILEKEGLIAKEKNIYSVPK